jgi:hypothetical protein
MRYLLQLALALLTGCLSPTGADPARSSNWRAVASVDDRDRLRDWRPTFEDALASARAAGHAGAIAAEGDLLRLDAALGGTIPNGNFSCRTLKLGARGDSNRDYIAYPSFPCRIASDGAVQSFAVLAGAQRPSGTIFPGDRLRGVFLGGLSLGDESAPMRYGTDPDRSLAGWVERIGDARWRILLPDPHLESQFDVIELLPSP